MKKFVLLLSLLSVAPLFANDKWARFPLLPEDSPPGSITVYFEPDQYGFGYYVYSRDGTNPLYSSELPQPNAQGNMFGPINFLGSEIAGYLGFDHGYLLHIPTPEFLLEQLPDFYQRRFMLVDGVIPDLEFLEAITRGVIPLSIAETNAPNRYRYHSLAHDFNNHLPLHLLLPQAWLDYLKKRIGLFLQLRTELIRIFGEHSPIVTHLEQAVTFDVDTDHGSTNNRLNNFRMNPADASNRVTLVNRLHLLITGRMLHTDLSSRASYYFRMDRDFPIFIEGTIRALSQNSEAAPHFSDQVQERIVEMTRILSQDSRIAVELPNTAEGIADHIDLERERLLQALSPEEQTYDARAKLRQIGS